MKHLLNRIFSLIGQRAREKRLLEPHAPATRNWEHHRFVVVREGIEELLTASALERRFSIKYNPQIEFAAKKDFVKIERKVLKYRMKQYLEREQIWLGAYFKKEILDPAVPPVELRWIDETIGWGVFAARDLPAMHYIGEYAGLVRGKKSADSKNAYCFQYTVVQGETTRLTIDAKDQGGIVRFINHSDTPNLDSSLATIENLSHVVLYTLRPIKKGEQLCYSYGPDYWKKRGKPKKL